METNRVIGPAIRYSEAFKLQIVGQLEREGGSVQALRRKYGIGGAETVPNWLRRYPATKFAIAKCACGADHFRLYADRDEGCAKRQCTSCGKDAFICDSEEISEEASFKKARCKCKKDVFDVAVGFALRDTGEIKWITVGARCVSCGMLGAYVDWKIDYSPTDHLYSMV